jgi:hypothetical protein
MWNVFRFDECRKSKTYRIPEDTSQQKKIEQFEQFRIIRIHSHKTSERYHQVSVFGSYRRKLSVFNNLFIGWETRFRFESCRYKHLSLHEVMIWNVNLLCDFCKPVTVHFTICTVTSQACHRNKTLNYSNCVQHIQDWRPPFITLIHLHI